MARRILIWEPSPWPIHLSLLSSLGKALKLCDCDVLAVYCDNYLKENPTELDRTAMSSWCEIIDRYDEPLVDLTSYSKKYLDLCKKEIDKFEINSIGTSKLINLSNFNHIKKIASQQCSDSFQSLTYNNIQIGLSVFSSCYRYYFGSQTKFSDELIKKNSLNALFCLETAKQAINLFKPDVIIMTHGFYVQWGPIKMLAENEGIDVLIHSSCYKEKHIYLSKTTEFNRMQQGSPSKIEWEDMKKQSLSNKQFVDLKKFIHGRYNFGSADLGKVHQRLRNSEDLRKILNFTDKKPIWGIFPNLLWEVAADSIQYAFETPEEWLLQTVDYIIKRDDINWFIKAHPSEKAYRLKVGVIEIIEDNFSTLPPNVRLIRRDEKINTMDILEIISGGITLAGITTGIEALMLGKPWITAGNCLYSEKSLSLDGLTKEKYFKLLDAIPNHQPLTKSQIEQINRLAYYYFLEREMPLDMFETNEALTFSKFNDEMSYMLNPKNNETIDTICQQIISGKMSFKSKKYLY